MEPVGINYLAVLIGAVAYMTLGALWYSPVLFAKAWMKGIGRTKEQVESGASPINYVVGLVTAFIASYGIARIMLWTGRHSIADGIVIGLFIGICFVFTSLGVNDTFEKRPKLLTAINVLYHTLGFIIIGIIIGAW